MMNSNFVASAVFLVIDIATMIYVVRRIRKADREIDELTHQLRIERWVSEQYYRECQFYSRLAELRERKTQQILAMQIIAQERPVDHE